LTTAWVAAAIAASLVIQVVGTHRPSSTIELKETYVILMDDTIAFARSWPISRLSQKAVAEQVRPFNHGDVPLRSI
jgi:hypothetical protein